MSFIQWLKSTRHKAYLWLYHRYPIQKNKILLWANEFKMYGDSPKYIAEYLAGHEPGKYDLVWVLNKDVPLPENIPDEIRVVRYFSIQYLKEISTAKVIICNARTGEAFFFQKR